MRRNRKGTTRTGAIPMCMAEVSPARSQRIRFNAALDANNRAITRWYAEAFLRENPRFFDGLEGVRLFTRSHPPQGRA